MGRRTLLVIASVLVAATGTALIWLYVQGADARARGTWQDLVTVLVATENIPVGAGRGVVAQRSRPRQLPRDLVPASPIGDPAAIGARTTTTPVLAGQVIVEGQFASSNAPVGVADGMMGVDVAMDDASRAASLLRPGSDVAVYVIANDQRARHVQNLLAKVRVIGVAGQTAFKNPDGASAKVGSAGGVSSTLVTLEVDGKDAAKLIAWSGSLYFTLLGKGAQGSSSDAATAAIGPGTVNG